MMMIVTIRIADDWLMLIADSDDSADRTVQYTRTRVHERKQINYDR